MDMAKQKLIQGYKFNNTYWDKRLKLDYKECPDLF